MDESRRLLELVAHHHLAAHKLIRELREHEPVQVIEAVIGAKGEFELHARHLSDFVRARHSAVPLSTLTLPMASLDSLPPDQRAVLQLVLQRGRSYDEIAQMLSIDRAAVRERALGAFDALGPSTRVPPEQRALITDYLLGQLPEGAAQDTHRGLADSANERAWARVVASELGTLAAGPLPEIPTDGGAAGPVDAAATSAGAAATEPAAAAAAATEPTDTAETATAEPVATGPAGPADPAAADGATADAAEAAGAAPSSGRRRFGRGGDGTDASGHPVSRRDGAILLGGGVVLIVAIVIAIILISGGSSPKKTTSTAANVPTTTAAQSTTTSTSASSTAAIKPLAQVNLTSPQAGSKTKGIAIVVRQSGTTAIELAAQAVPANTSHDAYAVWLYNSPSDATLLGFVNPGVKSDGVLRTLGRLPANASHFKQLLVTRETQAKPHAPGTIVLQGSLSLPSA